MLKKFDWVGSQIAAKAAPDQDEEGDRRKQKNQSFRQLAGHEFSQQQAHQWNFFKSMPE
jgi:hypothetical protein